MRIITRFLTAGFLAVALPVSLASAQVPTPDSDAELHIKRLEKQADSLKKEARHLKDSLHIKIRHKDFGNLFLNTDSLLNKFKVFSFDSSGEFHFDADSAHWFGHFPDSFSFKGWTDNFKDWTNKLPKNFHYEIPDLPEGRFFHRVPEDHLQLPVEPKKEKKKSPVPGFGGWYMQELAKL